MSQAVRVEGASCLTGPSPTARAMRLSGLHARDAGALEALLRELPPPPWDVELEPEDPVGPALRSAGFAPYARMSVMARAVDGLPPALRGRGVQIVPYRNEWAEEFCAAEAAAMADLAVYGEMGSPTGYEGAEGFDSALCAREGARIVGFAQAMLPEGWINWLGVVPDARRRGIGHRLVAETARAVREARGTHLAALVETATDGQAFLAALGLRERGRRTLLIRRPEA